MAFQMKLNGVLTILVTLIGERRRLVTNSLSPVPMEFNAYGFPELGGCADCRETDCACLACSLRGFLEDSSPYDGQEFCLADDQCGRSADTFMAPADSAGTAEGVLGGSDRYQTAPMAPVDGTNRCELPLDDLVDAFFGDDAAGGLPGARRQAPSPSPEVRKKPLPERITPESNKRSRNRVCLTPVPCNNGESGRRLVELALEAASADNSVAESAYLFRASGQADGANRDGNVYKYARYIGEICTHGISRNCLLSRDVDDKKKVAEVIRIVSASHSSVSSSGSKISYNYNRAVDLYRKLSSSFATDAE